MLEVCVVVALFISSRKNYAQNEIRVYVWFLVDSTFVKQNGCFSSLFYIYEKIGNRDVCVCVCTKLLMCEIQNPNEKRKKSMNDSINENETSCCQSDRTDRRCGL